MEISFQSWEPSVPPISEDDYNLKWRSVMEAIFEKHRIEVIKYNSFVTEKASLISKCILEQIISRRTTI